MHEYSIEELRGKILNLPDELQDILFDPETALTIERAATEHDLNPEQIENVLKVVADVVLANITIQNLDSVLQQNIGMNPQAANLLARKLEQQVFQLVLHLLQPIKHPTETSVANQEMDASSRFNELYTPPSAPAPENQPLAPSVIRQKLAEAGRATPPRDTFKLPPQPQQPMVQKIAEKEGGSEAPRYTGDPYREPTQ